MNLELLHPFAHHCQHRHNSSPLHVKLKVLDLLQGHNLTMLIKSLINTLTWLKSDAILSVVDRTVAIFTTRCTILLYEFQECY